MIGSEAWAWGVAAAPGIVWLAAAGLAMRLNRPIVDRAPVHDVLILAAHSDDCAICAGEYAIDAASAGRWVGVVYLTCGDRQTGTERARTRCAEAVACWGSLGVPESRLTFLDLANSPMHGPRLYADDDLDRVRASLVPILRSLPQGARVVVPAAGETHIDHRTLRAVALQAARDAGRSDLCLLEAPEYNPYVSVWRSPGRALVAVVKSLPLVSRLAPRLHGMGRAGFIAGPPGLIRPPSAGRLEGKRRLLRAFTSENPDVLVRHFGHPDLYRPLRLGTSDDRPPRGYLRIGDRRWGVLSVGLWLSVWALGLLAGVTVAARLRGADAWGVLGWACVVVGVGVVARAVLRRSDVERRLTLSVVGAGLVAGGLDLVPWLAGG